MNPLLGNIVALSDEARTLFGRRNWQYKNKRMVLEKGFYGGARLMSIQSGMGLENAYSAANWMISKDVSAVAVLGVSGGLSPDLNAGDIILGDTIFEENDHQARDNLITDPVCTEFAYHTLKNRGFSVYRGSILSVSRPLLTQQEKLVSHQKSNAFTVDMESAAVARVSKDAGIPLFVMRVVSDSANTTIPKALFDSLNPDGTIRWPELLGMLWRRPRLLGDLVHRGREYHSSLRVLKMGWQVLIENDLPRRLTAL